MSIASNTHAQLLDRLKNTAKNKIEERLERKVSEVIDQEADKAEESVKQQKKNDKKEKPSNTSEVRDEKNKVKPKNKDQFIAGDVELFIENFNEDVVEEFPLKWYTNNKGITADLGKDGKWLRMYHSSKYLSPNFSEPLPEDFTVEFDLLVDLKYDGYVFPDILIQLINSKESDKDGRKFMMDDDYNNSLTSASLLLSPGHEGSSRLAIESRANKATYFSKEAIKFDLLDKNYGKKIKVNIWAQKQRLRVWFDDVKVLDIPQALPSKHGFNRLTFSINNSIQPDEEIKVLVSNVRCAVGKPDLREKLLKEGKFVTNGIYFDTNQSKIKANSLDLIEEIAELLTENKSMRFNIVGHTDGDGSVETNRILSQRRAEAVKQILCEKYNIDSSRLTTEGKGEDQPIADNQTEAGKAKNRRVEFIRL